MRLTNLACVAILTLLPFAASSPRPGLAPVPEITARGDELKPPARRNAVAEPEKLQPPARRDAFAEPEKLQPPARRNAVAAPDKLGPPARRNADAEPEKLEPPARLAKKDASAEGESADIGDILAPAKRNAHSERDSHASVEGESGSIVEPLRPAKRYLF